MTGGSDDIENDLNRKRRGSKSENVRNKSESGRGQKNHPHDIENDLNRKPGPKSENVRNKSESRRGQKDISKSGETLARNVACRK